MKFVYCIACECASRARARVHLRQRTRAASTSWWCRSRSRRCASCAGISCAASSIRATCAATRNTLRTNTASRRPRRTIWFSGKNKTQLRLQLCPRERTAWTQQQLQQLWFRVRAVGKSSTLIAGERRPPPKPRYSLAFYRSSRLAGCSATYWMISYYCWVASRIWIVAFFSHTDTSFVGSSRSSNRCLPLQL